MIERKSTSTSNICICIHIHAESIESIVCVCVHAFISLRSLFRSSCIYVDLRTSGAHNRKLSVVMFLKLCTVLSGTCVRVRVFVIRMTSGPNTYCCTSRRIKKPLLLTYNGKLYTRKLMWLEPSKSWNAAPNSHELNSCNAV